MRDDVLLGGRDPIAERNGTGEHVRAREALAVHVALHDRRRVEARRSGSDLDNDLATVVELKTKYLGQVPAMKDLANRRCAQHGRAPCRDRFIEVHRIYLTPRRSSGTRPRRRRGMPYLRQWNAVTRDCAELEG